MAPTTDLRRADRVRTNHNHVAETIGRPRQVEAPDAGLAHGVRTVAPQPIDLMRRAPRAARSARPQEPVHAQHLVRPPQAQFRPAATRAPVPWVDLDEDLVVRNPRAAAPAPKRRHSLQKYNDALSIVRADINAAMSPGQRNAARFLNVAGLAGSVAGAVMMGLFATTALAGVASGIGAPVAALAAAAGVLTFIGGVILTVLSSAIIRAIVRRSVQSVPGLDVKIQTLQAMRQDLRDLKRRTPAEKALLRNIDIVLGKIEEANNNVASQAKFAIKSMGMVATGGVLAFFAAFELATSKEKTRPVTGGREFLDAAKGVIHLPEGDAQLQRLMRRI